MIQESTLEQVDTLWIHAWFSECPTPVSATFDHFGFAGYKALVHDDEETPKLLASTAVVNVNHVVRVLCKSIQVWNLAS